MDVSLNDLDKRVDG